MVIRLLIVLYIVATAQEYVSLSDPDQLTYIPANYPSVLPVLDSDEAIFTRFTISTEFSITAWVLIESHTDQNSNPKEILNFKGASDYWYAWLNEGSGIPSINLNAGAAGAQSTLSYQIPTTFYSLVWQHVTVSTKDQTYKLIIGEFTTGVVSTQDGTGTSLLAVDLYTAGFQLGSATPQSSFNGWILDARLYNQELDSTFIGNIILTTTCHATCSTCWGPGAWSCLDKIQAAPIYGETTATTTNPVKYQFNDPMFERTRYAWTAETSWAGFVQNVENTQLQGTYQAIFVTANDWFSADFQSLPNVIDYSIVNGFYLQVDAEDSRIASGTMHFGITDHDQELYDTYDFSINSWPSDGYRWIGLSFCSDKLILCVHQLDTNDDPTCNTYDNPASKSPQLWSGLGTDNEMYLGPKNQADQTTNFKDVRYYMKGCKSETDLTALYSEQAQLCVSGCLTCSDFQTWGTCQTGRYLDTNTGTCPLCSYTCAACGSKWATDCSACIQGQFLQYGLSICYGGCAFGFTANSTTWTCDGTPGLVFEQDFNFTGQVYTHTSGISVQSGQTSNSEDSDPVVTTNRGFVFDGVDDVVVISGSPMLTMNANFTVTMWLLIAADSNGSSCALSKQTTNNAVFFQMCFTAVTSTTSSAEATIQLDDQYILSNSGKTITHGEWFIWIITGLFEIGAEKETSSSTIESYINLSPHATITSADGLQDSDTNDFKLGTGLVNRSVLSYFKGNIHNLSLYNQSQTNGQAIAVVGASWPSSCQSACLTTLQCVDACAAPLYTVEDDASACLTVWASSGYYFNTAQYTCQPCATANCQTCTSVSTCAKWATGYLGPTGTCDDACPSNYVSNSDNVWEACHETWTTCSSTSVDGCLTCIDGWRRSSDENDSSDCLCDMNILDNTTASLQVACMNAPFSQRTISQSEQIVYIEAIANDPDLNTEDLGVVFDVSDELEFEDTSAQSDFNEVLNQASLVALENSGESSYTYSGSDVQVHLERGDAGSFEDAELLTESGSGVVLSSLDDVLDANEPVQFNVFSYNDSQIDQTNDTLIDQVLSIEAFYTADGSSISLTNLTSNLTIVFDGLNLNTTWTYECVYMLPNYTWSPDGCYLSSLLEDVAECTCNHLSQFSMRSFGASANVDTNIGATVDIDNITNFDLSTSSAPIICLGIIYGLYITLLILLWKLDAETEKIKNEIFVKSRTMRVEIHTALSKKKTNEPQSIKQNSFNSDRNLIVQSDDEDGEVNSPQPEDIIGPADETIAQPQNDDSERIDQIESDLVEKIEDPNAELSNSNVISSDNDLILEQHADDETQIEKEKPQRGKFRSIFLDKHQVIGMLCDKHDSVSRAEKLTIILVLLMLELFAIGLFYDQDRDPDEEETEKDKTVEETVEEFGYEDFWITIYTLLIVIPVPIILKSLFSRPQIELDANPEETEKAKKTMKIKRVIGYIICFVVCAWCTWSIVAFSTEFGHNTSQIWLVNFGITTLGDIICKDVIVATFSVLIALYLPALKEKCKKKKIEPSLDPVVATPKSTNSIKPLI